MRSGRLQSVEAVVERQQGVLAEGDDGLFLDGQDGRSGLPRPSRQIGDRRPRLPLGDGLRINPVAPGQGPQALSTMLIATERLCRCGAPM
jgi:hypothetical protein